MDRIELLTFAFERGVAMMISTCKTHNLYACVMLGLEEIRTLACERDVPNSLVEQNLDKIDRIESKMRVRI